MKRFFYVMLTFVVMSITNSVAQVTIGSMDEPNATLDVRSNSSDLKAPDGIIVPRLTGNELFAKSGIYGADQNDALVYVTAAASSDNQILKTVNVKAPGYYYYDAANSVWTNFATDNQKAEWFYMPSSLLDVVPDTQEPKTADLFALYKDDITTSSVSSDASHPFVEFRPELTADDFYYYVVGYDKTLFSDISISSKGIMTYTVLKEATDESYIDIAFVRK